MANLIRALGSDTFSSLLTKELAVPWGLGERRPGLPFPHETAPSPVADLYAEPGLLDLAVSLKPYTGSLFSWEGSTIRCISSSVRSSPIDSPDSPYFRPTKSNTMWVNS